MGPPWVKGKVGSKLGTALLGVLVGLVCLVFPPAGAHPSQPAGVDLMIRNGRLLDGSGAPPVEADLAIAEGRIVAIGDLTGMAAAATIHASGYYVTPGFIDLHSHADWGLSDPHLAGGVNFLTQGVTTVVVGQDGRHAWPVGSTLGRQTTLWHSQGIGLNVVPLAGQGSARLEVMGWDPGPATPVQARAIADRVRFALGQGAWGISSGLSYLPGRYSTTEEVIEAVRPVAEIEGVYISHLRDQGVGLRDSVQELLRIGRETGARVVATHIKAVGRRNWGTGRAVVTLLENGRREGVRAYADLYPYTTSSDGIEISLVPWSELFQEGEMQGWLPPVDLPVPTLLDWVYRLQPELARHYTADFLKAQPEAVARGIAAEQLLARLRPEELYRRRLWQAWSDPKQQRRLRETVRRRLDGPGGAEIFAVIRHSDERLVGLTLPQVARMRGSDEIETAVELVLEGAALAQFHMSEEDVMTFIQRPWVAGSTDGWIPEYGEELTHPRSYGAFTRRLRRYVFDLRVIPLPFAIHTATGLAAEILGLQDRGYLKAGQQADILVFDPLRLRDRATFSNPHQYSEGIEWVLISGELVLERGRPTGRRAGRVLLRTDD